MKKFLKQRLKEMKEFETEEEPNRTTNTAFILMFPSVIFAGIAAFYAPLAVSILATILAIYQFLMMKKFIEDYYRNR